MSDYVRALGAYTFNDHSRPSGDRTVMVKRGELLRADNWAVRENADRFEPVRVPDDVGELIDARARACGELAGIAVRHGDNEDKWPEGQRQRAENIVRRVDKIDSSLAPFETRNNRREDVMNLIRSGRYLTEGSKADPDPADVEGHSAHERGGLHPLLPGAGGQLRDAAMRTVDAAVRSKTLPDHAASKVERLVTDGPERDRSIAARWAVAAGDPAYRSAFAKLCADPTRGHLLWTPDEHRAFQAVAEVRTAMSLTDANGGFMVPLTLDPAIMLTSDGSINPLRQISRVVQTTTDTWQGVTSAGATAEWKAEAAQAADGAPTVDDAPIPVHFGDVFVPYSYEIGMDAVNFLGELTNVLVDAAANHQLAAYTTGSGTGQPRGVITALAGTASEINGGGTEALAVGDPLLLQNALPARFSARAQWGAHIATINAIGAFETTNGALRYPEVSQGQLLRKPLNEISNMDGAVNAAATANNYLLVYGDFTNFVIVDRIGSTMEFVPNLVGANGRPTGQRGAFLWYRTGSDVVVPQAFRLLDVPTTA
ncbi:phage major capsid protein [Jiangella muralis]|uniref:phage major capsid protein n=1 Tax=Jiangella muralis TaxID=702383 RepID=UPI00069FF24C|nr:phage major capsid protein [Jiangella muralis]